MSSFQANTLRFLIRRHSEIRITHSCLMYQFIKLQDHCRIPELQNMFPCRLRSQTPVLQNLFSDCLKSESQSSAAESQSSVQQRLKKRYSGVETGVSRGHNRPSVTSQCDWCKSHLPSLLCLASQRHFFFL